ncbi:hypothetical protein [Pseudaquabacterium pictum]|uniref:hypothetical protein n=1 Tax=Pseudaquabacterium pictum TaxID=2315236 RepID=UPI00223EA48A|nr:hypothetical protein [Rubrivivax pictus]
MPRAQGLGLDGWQHAHQGAAQQVVADEVGGQHGDAGTGQRSLAHRGRLIA